MRLHHRLDLSSKSHGRLAPPPLHCSHAAKHSYMLTTHTYVHSGALTHLYYRLTINISAWQRIRTLLLPGRLSNIFTNYPYHLKMTNCVFMFEPPARSCVACGWLSTQVTLKVRLQRVFYNEIHKKHTWQETSLCKTLFLGSFECITERQKKLQKTVEVILTILLWNDCVKLPAIFKQALKGNSSMSLMLESYCL